MLPITGNQEFLAYALLLGAIQLAAVAAFRRLLLSGAPAPASLAEPVVVIAPCKGALPGLEAAARALLSQDHPDFEVLFVVPSEDDPAAVVLRPLAAASSRAKLLVSRAPAPTGCSGKIVDLLFALDRLPERARVVAFVDADLRVRPDWLRALTAPLEGAAAERPAVTTSCALYVAPDPGFWSFLRMLWMAMVVPYAALMGVVVGQSYALRREDVDALGLRALWSRSLLEDIVISGAVRAAGRHVRFVGAALSASEEPCDAAGFGALLNKWVLCLRVYDKRIWLCAWAAVLMHGAILWWWAARGITTWAPAAMLAGDMLAAALQLASYSRAVPDRLAALHACWRPPWLWAALCAPFLWLAYAYQLSCSLFGERIRWGGRVYALRGPQDVEVVG